MRRRNISITNEKVEFILDTSDNASKLIEKCILEHYEKHENDDIGKMYSILCDCIGVMEKLVTELRQSK